MPKRRVLRVAVVALRSFAVAASLFSLSALASIIGQLVRGKTDVVYPLFSAFLIGAAVAALFFVLSEAGMILIGLEEQQDRLRERLEEMNSGAAENRTEESE